jgi:hypothetical protein
MAGLCLATRAIIGSGAPSARAEKTAKAVQTGGPRTNPEGGWLHDAIDSNQSAAKSERRTHPLLADFQVNALEVGEGVGLL